MARGALRLVAQAAGFSTQRRKDAEGAKMFAGFVAWMQRSGIRVLSAAVISVNYPKNTNKKKYINKTNELKNIIEVDYNFRVTAR